MILNTGWGNWTEPVISVIYNQAQSNPYSFNCSQDDYAWANLELMMNQTNLRGIWKNIAAGIQTGSLKMKWYISM